jgi:gamma-glutamylputrescine oxidase
LRKVAHKQRYVSEYHALADKLATQYGRQGIEKLDAKRTRELLGTDAFFGGYVDWDAAHLHPLNWRSASRDAASNWALQIFENTRATAFTDGASVTVRTQTGSVTADHLVLAANGHLGNLAPKLAGRMMPINNFIIATEPLDEALPTRSIRGASPWATRAS